MPKLRHRLAREFFGKTLHPVLLLVLIVLLALSVAALVYVSGGTKYVYVQMMYLPIVLCGLLFHARYGFLFGVLAGLMVGRLMPLEVATQTYQPTEAWLLRMVFFCINGTIAGAVADLLRHRIRLLEQVQHTMSAWTAWGYPNRIKGSAIPLEARILAVVDVFEALTSWRPYHEARDPKTALEMVRTESGTHFDPQVVNVFTTLLRRGHLIGETNMHLLGSIKDRYRGGGLFWQNCGLNPNFEASTCLCCVARDTLF